ncbi:methionyl-tRNA formyltransferase [Pseudothermotoga thermarum]|uniref:Methionyl-tRNA formyltransferase n=1 Tax=Pseudothermotoga thermarum DSM 5069 TaxID=688269 RepID=F7YYT9_9THEM|nr:methionyl-tRNA formyltransferase [Pseudothermotoga thermarum]AEH51127.1 methionyl-tRNA formyltransferase [Pseudothermotoga thermarum DSM 5069]
MRIIFLGTPEYSAKHLQVLLDEGFNVVAVVTQPDKPKGRGLKVLPSPVKLLALQRGIPVFEKLKDVPFDQIKPDIGIVVAYGALIKKHYLDILPMGFYNVHPSLLPKYRGAAPINRAIENGEKVTGVTIFKLTEQLDAGPIALQEKLQIGEYETFGELQERLIELGCKLLVEFLKNIDHVKLIPQDDKLATYAPKINPEDLLVDFSKQTVKVKDKIRAYDPNPGVKANLNGQLVKLFKVTSVKENGQGDPGRIIRIDELGAHVKTSDGVVVISDVQFPSKKRMRFLDAMNGRLVKVGDIFQ